MLSKIKQVFVKRKLDNSFFELLRLRDEEIELLNERSEVQDKLIKLYDNKLKQHGIRF